jgi:hypothetical protein
MRDLVLRLEAERCIDGVKRVQIDDPPAVRTRYGNAGPIWFFWRSDHYEPVIQEAVDLENPLVVRFVNADDDDKRIKFLSRFGLPEGFLLSAPGSKRAQVCGRFFSAIDLPEGFLLGGPGVSLPFESRDFILGEQRELRHLLEDAGSGDVARMDKAASRALRFVGGDSEPSRRYGRTAFTVRTLSAFMYFEINAVVENGARVARCKWCDNFFLYGKGTKGRSTAIYCRDVCRVDAYRANKRKGD